MPITFGASIGTAVGTTPGTTWTLTTTGAVPSGGTVVVGLAWFNASATYTVSGGGLTWTMPAAKTDGSSRNVAQAFAPAPSGLASGTVLTFTVASGSFTNSSAACYVNSADTLDVNGTGGSGSTQAWSGSITTSDPNTIVFGFGYNDGLAAGTSTPGSGYTEWCDFQNGADVNVLSGVYQIVTSAGAYTPGGTWSAGTNPWVTATLSLKAGGGGGGGGGTSTDAASNLLTGPFDRVPPAAFMPGGRLQVQRPQDAPPPPPGPTPPYFTTIGGSTPQFVVSSEDWGILSNAARNPNPASGGTYQTTFDNYFAARAAQGYNAIEVSIAHIIDYDGAQNGPDGDGVYPFTGSSLDPTGTRNTTWWDRRDYFFSSAASHGFRVFCNITTPYLSAGAFTASWTSAQWTAWGNHLAAKYPNSTHPHVFWIVGDDYFGEKDTELQALYNALNSGGATQPKSIQWSQEATSRKDIYNGASVGTSSWSTAAEYNWGYSYNVWYDVVEKMGLENNTLTPIPYVAGDGYFLNSSSTGLTDKQLMRRMVWWAISSGAKAVNVGNNSVYHWDSASYTEATTNTFYTSVMPAIVGVVNSLPNWHQLLADTSSQLVTGGRGTHAAALVSGGSGGQYLTDTDSYVSASYIQSGANAGTLAVIYMSHASTITIDESKLVAGYTAKWVDPANGAMTTATPGPTYNSGSKGNNSDGQADWVLVLGNLSSGDATFTTTVGDASFGGGSSTFTGDATFTTTVGDAAFAGGTSTFTGDATFTTTAGDAAFAGGSSSFTGDATFTTTAGDAAFAGGSSSFAGDATFTTTVGDSTWDGGISTFSASGDGMFSTTVGDAAFGGGSSTFSGDATFSTVVGDSTWGGGSSTFTGGTSGAGNFDTLTGDASFAGGSSTFTGDGLFSTTAGDAAWSGGSSTFSVDVTFTTLVGDTTWAGGSSSFTAASTFTTTVGDSTWGGGVSTFTGGGSATFTTLTGDSTWAGGVSTMFAGEPTLPAGRTLVVLADNRVLVVEAEDRITQA